MRVAVHRMLLLTIASLGGMVSHVQAVAPQAGPESVPPAVAALGRATVAATQAAQSALAGRKRPEAELRKLVATAEARLAAAEGTATPAVDDAAQRMVSALQSAVTTLLATEPSRLSPGQRDLIRTQLEGVGRAARELEAVARAGGGERAGPSPAMDVPAWALPVGVALAGVLGLVLAAALARRWRSRRAPSEAGAPARTVHGDATAEMQRLVAQFFERDGTSGRDLMNAVMGALGDALIIVDVDGVVRAVNAATCTLLGYDEADVIGHAVDEFVLAGDEATAEWQSGAVLRDVTVRYLTRDREIVPMSLSMAPVRDGGRLLGTIGVARDMRERLKLMAEVEQARDAAIELSRIKSEFLANMSHEIRTPMNAIIGYTDIALETEMNAVQRGYLDSVRRAAVALLGIINEVLDFSRIEAGKLSLEKLPFSLRDVMMDTMRTLAVRADEKQIEFACRVAQDVPDGIVGDPNRLRQVLMNLLGNALKFTDVGEVIATVEVEPGSSRDMVTLHFTVRDTGIGIPADKQDLIFHPFTQADGSMSRTYGGTGLGLAIATQLVELMGGRIWVSSAERQGSTFHFTILAGLSGDESRAPRTVASLRGVRALVVEDNATVGEIVAELLRLQGMRVQVVDEAETALNAIEHAIERRDPIGVLVSDIGLPGADGFELVEYILREPALRELPLVVLGQATKATDAARARSLGVGYVTKPIAPADLYDVLRHVLAAEGDAAVPVPGEMRPSLRALVADDNPLNRRMLALLLEQRGHAVVTVSGGRAAVEAVKNDAFDMILMDVHMPDVDGIQATTEIRALQEGRTARVPIVALTGHAMQGDRERCLRAGMDAYLIKPVEAADLFATLDQLVPNASGHQRLAGLAGLPPSVIDPETLLQRVDGNRKAFVEILKFFREDTQAMCRDVEDALGRRDGEQLERAAARLASALRTVAAPVAAAAAADLQEKGHQRDFHRAREAWSDLSRELERLDPALQTLLARDAGL